MLFKTVAIYCVCDDFIRLLPCRDDPQCKMTTSEVMTVGLVAAMFYGGNIALARKFLLLHGYFSRFLSHTRLLQRLLSIPLEIWEAVFHALKAVLSHCFPSDHFIIDSCPIPICLPCRSWRCRLYDGKQYLGYCASKKLYYYGLKIHLIISSRGVPMEVIFTPASRADISGLRSMDLDLPPGSIIFGDRAYNSKALEDELKAHAKIQLIPQRRRKTKRPHSPPMQFLQKCNRRKVETAFGEIARLLPRSIQARTPKGFELRVFLFIFAYAIKLYCTAIK